MSLFNLLHVEIIQMKKFLHLESKYTAENWGQYNYTKHY